MAILGCIADDFTGASDAASFLVKGGMSVQLYNGIPENASDLKPVQAIVIALKSRTQETLQAVADSKHAAQFLLDQGITHLYFKYCSTFDSTPGQYRTCLRCTAGTDESTIFPALSLSPGKRPDRLKWKTFCKWYSIG